MAATRWELVDELHHIDQATGIVVTVLRWDATNTIRPRTRITVVHDGKRSREEVYRVAADLEHLNRMLDARRASPGQLTDQQARELVFKRTGTKPPMFCDARDCGAALPLGSPRCEAGHRAAAVTSGSLSGARRRGTINVDWTRLK